MSRSSIANSELLVATLSSQRPASNDVLGPVLAMGRNGVRIGAGIGLFCAAILHGYMVFRVYSALWGMEAWIRGSRKEMSEYFLAFGPEIDTSREEPKKEEKKEEPEPEVKEQVTEPVVDQKIEQKQVQRPVAQEQPSKSLYDDDKPVVNAGGGQEGPLDLTGKGPLEAAGSGGGFGGGKGTGIGSGEGNGRQNVPPPPPPPPPPPAPDQSKPAELLGSKSWSCPFPPEADAEGVDSAVVQLVVTVGPDGTAEKVSIMSDPGSGFGRAARSCALGRRYKAGLDREGKPSRKTTPPLTVRFTR